MKHIPKQLLATLLALMGWCLSVSAYDFEVDGIYYNITSEVDLTCEVKHTTRLGVDVVIPSCVDYYGKVYTVTAIGEKAFYQNSYVQSVVIPRSVTEIKDEAFYECENMESIVIPNTVMQIGSHVFYIVVFNKLKTTRNNKCKYCI